MPYSPNDQSAVSAMLHHRYGYSLGTGMARRLTPFYDIRRHGGSLLWGSPPRGGGRWRRTRRPEEDIADAAAQAALDELRAYREDY